MKDDPWRTDRLNLMLFPGRWCINSNLSQSSGDYCDKRVKEWIESGAKDIELLVHGKSIRFTRQT
jgi:hypothetical protein